MKQVILIALIPVLFLSCKTEITQEIHKNIVVDGNQVPDYSGVSTLQVENYVNKLYIDLIGEEPTAAELDQKVALLKNSDLSAESREIIIDELLASDKYYKQLFNQTSAVYLNGLLKNEISDQILNFAYIREQSLINGDTLVAYILEYEIGKLGELIRADQDLKDGVITRNEFYGRFCLNYFFDQINMGSENFVKATFENMLGRFPTESELSNGEEMVNGFGGQLLLQSGNSKPDFVQIVSNSQEFYNHWVDLNYNGLMGRSSTAAELEDAFLLLANDDFAGVLISILKSDEYAGF